MAFLISFSSCLKQMLGFSALLVLQTFTCFEIYSMRIILYSQITSAVSNKITTEKINKYAFKDSISYV